MCNSNPPMIIRPLDRRNFLAATVAAGIGGARSLVAAEGGPVATPSRGLPVREFGKTGVRLPILGFGGSAMVEKWKASYGPQLPRDQRVAMVRHAFDSGIRYFDTSPNYGESEAILGEALHDVRDQVYLATKVGVPPSDNAILDRSQVRASLEASLERLRTDRVECVQIHGPVFEYLGVERAREIYEELVKLREEKLFRYLGVTAHNAFEAMYTLIDSGLADQALIGYGYFPKGMDTILSHANLAWRERCLSRARELGMGVVAMKVLGSFVFGCRAAEIVPSFTPEKLARLRRAALRWVLQDERVTLLVIGVTRPSDIDRNVETLRGDLAFRDEDRTLLAEFSAEAYRSPIIRRMADQPAPVGVLTPESTNRKP
jgi:aryl-alcohol dehydrogenase-like predicted oxidoreductase